MKRFKLLINLIIIFHITSLLFYITPEIYKKEISPDTNKLEQQQMDELIKKTYMDNFLEEIHMNEQCLIDISLYDNDYT